jgi:hypothetical protein
VGAVVLARTWLARAVILVGDVRAARAILRFAGRRVVTDAHFSLAHGKSLFVLMSQNLGKALVPVV